MDKLKKLVSDTMVFAVGNFTVKIIYFVLMPMYTLSLSAEQFGQADLLNNTLQLVLPIFTLSISDAVFRYCLDKGSNKSVLLTNGLCVLSISYVTLVFSISIAVCIFSVEAYWILFVVWYIFDSLRQMLAQYTRALGKIWVFSINGIIGAIVLLVVTYILLCKFRLGIYGYMLSFIISAIASIVYLVYKYFIPIYNSWFLWLICGWTIFEC